MISTHPVHFPEQQQEELERLGSRFKGTKYVTKLLIDRVLAAILLLVLLVPIITIALLIKVDSPGPVLYGQARVGRRGRLFTMYKFRSMIKDADRLQTSLAKASGQDGRPLFKLREDPRVTRVGRILRRTSLDELPQLMNVLRGEMSLVGPRPPLLNEVDCERRHLARLEAVPGMTGLWQVSGRSELSFEDMMRIDLEYIRRWSLILDCLILLKTVPVVFGCRGAY